MVGKLRSKVAVVLLLGLSDVSVFSLISDSRLLLLRPVRIHATWEERGKGRRGGTGAGRDGR